MAQPRWISRQASFDEKLAGLARALAERNPPPRGRRDDPSRLTVRRGAIVEGLERASLAQGRTVILHWR
jgi:hypothetical protein